MMQTLIYTNSTKKVHIKHNFRKLVLVRYIKGAATEIHKCLVGIYHSVKGCFFLNRTFNDMNQTMPYSFDLV